MPGIDVQRYRTLQVENLLMYAISGKDKKLQIKKNPRIPTLLLHCSPTFSVSKTRAHVPIDVRPNPDINLRAEPE
ncbi:hypothetical protein Pyn_31129 [Prunus yedoensis var. nudiflora]|uniref:Uncharacterized protein n=1 Tax=Prunus yedoensis var. nudiflora TaxID=2094558 RepID=A0A314UJ68_PRUYE|nr:hypothetical protein Pyn_31129 [Prunus yedoensis var. nudiflora]